MKKTSRVILIFLCLVLAGCSDDVISAGAGALAGDEEVRVEANTLGGMYSHTDSLADFVITQTPDSFLIGEVNTAEWTTIKAELMTQFACPEGYQFPADVSSTETTEIDSIALVMTCRSWFGDGTSPLRMSVYELDKATFQYEHVYSSEENVYDYWSGEDSTHVVKEDQIVVAAQPNDSVYSSTDSKYYPYIRFMMNDQFVRKMNRLKKFPKQNEFNAFFKGLYITTTWGASTALYVDNITLIVYYHYYFEEEPGKHKRMNDIKYLYANSEVRQVNRFSFPKKDQVLKDMHAQEDSINYVISPGYVYTVIKLPMQAYADSIIGSLQLHGDTLQPYINKALMRVDVVNAVANNSSSDRWASPATNMLLICKDSLTSFFSRNNVPSEDYCLLSTLTTSINSDYTYSYHYDFDVSTLLYNEVHKRMKQSTLGDMEMVMVPVDVEYSTSSSSVSVSRVKINQTITYTVLHSAQFINNPLDIDVVFSGFTINSLH